MTSRTCSLLALATACRFSVADCRDVDRRRPPRGRPRSSPCRRTGPGSNIVPRSLIAMTEMALPRPSDVSVVPSIGIDGDVGLRRGAVADALAVVQHGRFVLLALADHDDAVHRHGCEHDPHRVDGGAVGTVLVAPSHPPRSGQGRGLGDPDELQREVAVGLGHSCRKLPHPTTLTDWTFMSKRSEWQDASDASPRRDTRFETMSGLPLEPIYGPDDAEHPGAYPYTRGPRVDVSLEALDDADVRWLRHSRRHQRAVPGDPAVRWRWPLDGVRSADPHGPRLRRSARRRRGRQVRCRRRHARRRGGSVRRHRPGHHHDVDDDELPAAVIFAMYIACAEKTGVPRAKLGGTLQNDILKEFHAQKEFVFPPRPSMRLVRDTIDFCTKPLIRKSTCSSKRRPRLLPRRRLKCG